MKIGYARVSTQDQTAALQLDALRAAGCERIFEETASGANADRPGLADALAFARPGDVLVIWRLDRLGRSLRDLIDLAADLREREVELCSLQEAIDTTTAGGKMLFHIMAALAEFERNLIQERTKAGLASARARGRKGGRPGISAAVKEAIKSAAADPAANITAVCEALGINRATFYRHAPKVAEVKADAPAPSPVVNKSRKRAA